MPSLSQNLTFIQNSTSTVVLSYPNTGTFALTYISDPIKGSGYFGNSVGFHTTQVNLLDFIGSVEIQGTLASQPIENDWSSVTLALGSSCVDTTGAIKENTASVLSYNTETTTSRVFNFTGNYTWVRAKVSNWTSGAVTSIQINY